MSEQDSGWWVYANGSRVRLNVTLEDGSGGTWDMQTETARDLFAAGLTALYPKRSDRLRAVWHRWNPNGHVPGDTGYERNPA